MRSKIGKLLRWFLSGHTSVGYLMREDLSTVLRGRKETVVGRLTREERALKRLEIADCKERSEKLEEELLQDEAANPAQAGDFLKVNKPKWKVTRVHIVTANDVVQALRETGGVHPENLTIERWDLPF